MKGLKYMAGNNKQRKLLPIVLDGYKPLRDVVFETLRDAIIKQVLKPGERLMEIQLADEGYKADFKFYGQCVGKKHI